MIEVDRGPMSPCTGVCELDGSGMCRGCFRFLSEIGAWGLLTRQEREEIMRCLEERKQEFTGNGA